MIMGPHTGRGPKGFTRSDERLKEQISERLERHGELDASEIEVRVENGVATLEGKVEDRRAKRMAEELVEDVYGVRDVMNHLKVDKGFFAKLFSSSEERDTAGVSSGSSSTRKNVNVTR
jgi:osmotically-inducible protein OsmY